MYDSPWHVIIADIIILHAWFIIHLLMSMYLNSYTYRDVCLLKYTLHTSHVWVWVIIINLMTMVPYASSHHDRLLRVIIVVVEEVDWIVSRRVLEADKQAPCRWICRFPQNEKDPSSHIVVRARIAMYHQQQKQDRIDEFLVHWFNGRPTNSLLNSKHSIVLTTYIRTTQRRSRAAK
jgi:hypothetical protein